MIVYNITIAVAFIAHLYISIIKNESPLNVFLLILLALPFAPQAWRDIANLKINKDGVEINKLRESADKVIKKIAGKKSISSSDLDDLFKTVELNDWLTLVLARTLMRHGLSAMLPNEKLGDTPSLSYLLDMCEKKDVLSKQEMANLEKLRSVTFYAEWWSGNAPTNENWQWALSNCKEITKKLFDKQPIL